MHFCHPPPIVLLATAVPLSFAYGAQPSAAVVHTFHQAAAAIDKRGPLTCSATAGNVDTPAIAHLPVLDSTGQPVKVNGALLHHWWAAMLMDRVTPEKVVAVLQDYDHHSNIYAPEVRVSKILRKDGTSYDVLHETLSRNLIAVGLTIESVADWSGNPKTGLIGHSTSVRVREIDHAGTPRARERTAKEAKGWMWAEDSWWHVMPTAHGTCVTYETLALTRDYPTGLGWLLRPIAEHYPKETLSKMLRLTHEAAEREGSTQNERR